MMSRNGSTPSRRRTGRSSTIRTTVEPGEIPPPARRGSPAAAASHRIQSTSPVNSRTISSADPHATGVPERLADVPVTAPERPAPPARGTGWSGTRPPTVSPPPVTAGWTPGSAGSTSVRAPGQNRSIRRVAASGTCRVQRPTASAPDRSNGIGFRRSRALAANNRASPVSEHGSTPTPYRVSVGKITAPPARSEAITSTGKSALGVADLLAGVIDLSARSASRRTRRVKPTDSRVPRGGASWKPLRRLLDGDGHRLPDGPDPGPELRRRQGQDLRREVPRVLRPRLPHGHGRHRHARGHLRSEEHTS